MELGRTNLMPGCRAFAVTAWGLALSLCAAVHADSFTIEQWDLGVSTSRAWPDYAGAVITEVTNPLSASHQVALPSDPRTNAAAQYLMSWLGGYGSFGIDVQETAYGHPLGTIRTNASGSISITPAEDLSLWLHSSFAYDLHGQMTADLSTWVSGGDLPGLFSQTKIYDTIDGPPYSGTLQIGAEVILPAGHTWVLGYAMQLIVDQGSTGLTGTGVGSVSFEIFPEPNALALLAAPLLLIRPRRI